MCFATAALVAGGLGAAASSVGQIEAGKAQSAAAHYQSEVAKNNAAIAEQNAQYAGAAGTAAAERESLKGAAEAGRLKASQAANNVDVNSGSAVQVQQGQVEASRLDTLTAENNALLQAYGYKTQATSFEAQSKLDQMEADQAITGSEIGAAGSLLEKASSLGSNWASVQTG